MNQIDKITEVNLEILYSSKRQSIMTDKLVNPFERNQLSIHDAKVIARRMESEGLLDLTVERCDITSFGVEVSQLGGWLKFKELKRNKEAEENNKDIEKDRLTTENLELSNENLRYQKENREIKEKIDNLTEENLRLSNLNLYLTIGGFIAGIFITFIYNYFLK